MIRVDPNVKEIWANADAFMLGTVMDLEGNLWSEDQKVGRVAERFLKEHLATAEWQVLIELQPATADGVHRGMLPKVPKVRYMRPLFKFPSGETSEYDAIAAIEERRSGEDRRDVGNTGWPARLDRRIFLGISRRFHDYPTSEFDYFIEDSPPL